VNYRRIHRTSYVYLKRSFFWRRNSKPYISGDVFADNSDLDFYSPLLRGGHPTPDAIRDARVIFCPSHRLENLLDDFGSKISAKVLILGNSDRDFDSFDFRLPKSVKVVFAQNLNFLHKSIRVLPIGIENLRLGVNGTPWLFSENQITKEKLNQILVGPFSFTHNERAEFRSLQNNDWLEIVEGRMTPLMYAKYSSRFRYIASPRGNGLDTHRFWEALYRGSTPIVKRNYWSQMVSDLGIPLEEVENYSEGMLSKIALKSNFSNFQPKSIKSLWWPFWKEEIRKVF